MYYVYILCTYTCTIVYIQCEYMYIYMPYKYIYYVYIPIRPAYMYKPHVPNPIPLPQAPLRAAGGVDYPPP